MEDRIPYERCPLCESAQLADAAQGECSGHPLYHPSLEATIRWKSCTGCRHVFTEGYFSEEACRLIYGKTNLQQEVGYDFEGQRPVSARIVEKVLPHAKDGIWLDVGFGNGSLLFTAQEYGFTPVGVDVREEEVKRLSALGISACRADLETLSINHPCAVVSMADVLEHVPFPKQTLRAAHGLLGAGGVLFLSMPNLESMVWRLLDLQKANPYWSELEHYHNFGRSRLYDLLRECGFEPLSYGISERYRAGMEVLALKR